jgi:hypothetical protein
VDTDQMVDYIANSKFHFLSNCIEAGPVQGCKFLVAGTNHPHSITKNIAITTFQNYPLSTFARIKKIGSDEFSFILEGAKIHQKIDQAHFKNGHRQLMEL